VLKELTGHRSLPLTLSSTQLDDRTRRAQYDYAMAQVERVQGLQSTMACDIFRGEEYERDGNGRRDPGLYADLGA